MAPFSDPAVVRGLLIGALAVGGITLVGVAIGVADYFGWRACRGQRKPIDVELGPLEAARQKGVHDTELAMLAELRQMKEALERLQQQPSPAPAPALS